MEKLKDSLEIICPRCHNYIGVGTHVKEACAQCVLSFPQLHGVPILRTIAENERIDYTDHNHGLPIQDSTILPIPFIQEALLSGGLVLELGAGIEVCSAGNLVKTDAYLYSSDLDYVADGHCLPFPANTFDYVYSLAVFEHVHSPWIAAQEIFRVLKPNGKVYTLTAFNQHMHGYPSHFFNMTEIGLRRVFSQFEIVECGPSRFCPLNELGVSLADFVEMVQHLKQQRQRKHKDLTPVQALETSLREVIALIPTLQSELIEVPEAYPAWRKIAPGLDLIARKPKDQTSFPQAKPLERNPEVRYDTLEGEIMAMNTQLLAAEKEFRPPIQKVELDFEDLQQLDSLQRRVIARQKGVDHYLRVFRRDLKKHGPGWVFRRSFRWLKWFYGA